MPTTTRKRRKHMRSICNKSAFNPTVQSTSWFLMVLESIQQRHVDLQLWGKRNKRPLIIVDTQVFCVQVPAHEKSRHSAQGSNVHCQCMPRCGNALPACADCVHAGFRANTSALCTLDSSALNMNRWSLNNLNSKIRSIYGGAGGMVIWHLSLSLSQYFSSKCMPLTAWTFSTGHGLHWFSMVFPHLARAKMIRKKSSCQWCWDTAGLAARNGHPDRLPWS